MQAMERFEGVIFEETQPSMFRFRAHHCSFVLTAKLSAEGGCSKRIWGCFFVWKLRARRKRGDRTTTCSEGLSHFQRSHFPHFDYLTLLVRGRTLLCDVVIGAISEVYDQYDSAFSRRDIPEAVRKFRVEIAGFSRFFFSTSLKNFVSPATAIPHSFNSPHLNVHESSDGFNGVSQIIKTHKNSH